MTRYRYLKNHPNENTIKKKLQVDLNLYSIISKTLIISGLFVVLSVLWPILSYEIFTAPQLRENKFLQPVPSFVEAQLDEKSSQTGQLTDPKQWFPKANYDQTRSDQVIYYKLSIPKFDIENATVKVGGDDLKESLIHFPGTALPGEQGASVIFGHSTLPQLFKPDRYLSIFSLIPRLETSDEIVLKFDGVTYTYRVIDKIEVKPNDLSVLEQPYGNRYLRLITCTPPGTYLKRAVITAALVD